MAKFKRKHPIYISDPNFKKESNKRSFFNYGSMEEDKQRELEHKLRTKRK